MKKINLFSDVCRIAPELINDERGFFSEDYNKKKFDEIGITDNFIQDNISFSKDLFPMPKVRSSQKYHLFIISSFCRSAERPFCPPKAL